MTAPPVDLSALDALAEAATNAPWVIKDGMRPNIFAFEMHMVANTKFDWYSVTECDANAALIVALVNAYPALRAEIEALRGALDAATLLIRNAREAKNGTATDRDGEPLNGFVLDHHDYMALHCTLNDAALGATP